MAANASVEKLRSGGNEAMGIAIAIVIFIIAMGRRGRR
jgi:hypothetical protein